MVRTDPEGRIYPPTAYVFGELGKRVKSVKKAWETGVLKAHGYEPEWVAHGKLSPKSRAQLQAINLHFHDLRHEAGSRWHEAGWPLHHVQAMLGHASLEQTSTYLNVTRAGLLESMKRFDGNRCTTVAHGVAIEQRPLCNDQTDNDGKSLLH